MKSWLRTCGAGWLCRESRAGSRNLWMAAIQAHQVWSDFIHRFYGTTNGKWEEDEVEEEEIERTFLSETYNVCLQWLSFPKLSLLRSTHSLTPEEERSRWHGTHCCRWWWWPVCVFSIGIWDQCTEFKTGFHDDGHFTFLIRMSHPRLTERRLEPWWLKLKNNPPDMRGWQLQSARANNLFSVRNSLRRRRSISSMTDRNICVC